jgi:integrase
MKRETPNSGSRSRKPRGSGPRTPKTRPRRHLPYDVEGKDIPRELFPDGRIRFSLGTSDKPTAKKYRGLLGSLRSKAHYDVLRAIEDRAISVADVFLAFEQENANYLQSLQTVRTRIAAVQEVSKVPLFKQMVEDYLKWYEEKRAPNSFRSVAPTLRKVGRQIVDINKEGDSESQVALGTRIFDQVSVLDLETAIGAMGAPSYQVTVRKCVSGLYTWAIRNERDKARIEGRRARFDANPAKEVEILSGEDAEKITTLTEDEVRRLLLNAEPYQLAYLLPLIHVGFRDGELMHTRLGRDLDLDGWLWHVQSRGPDPDGCCCVSCAKRGWKPKSENSRRTLHIPAEPVELRQSILTVLALYPCKEGDHVFRNPRTGRKWEQWSLEGDFKRLCAKAGVTYGRDVPGGITIHSLRHTCATRLLRQGVRESVVAAILGDTVEVVVKYYIHLTPDDLAAGIGRSPAFLVTDAPRTPPRTAMRSRRKRLRQPISRRASTSARTATRTGS